MTHKIGDDIYIGSAIYMSSGSQDRVGGLAKITNIIDDPNLPEDHFNKTSIEVEGFPHTQFNYKYLLQRQEQWKEQFGESRAYADPDIDTPWIEPGDIVEGKKWTGDHIW